MTAINKEISPDMQNLKEMLDKSISSYQMTLRYMAGDAPIGVLCLPKAVETILSKQGYLRVYDLIALDLTKVKGLGDVRVRDLAARLDEFFAMSL
jgi:hypothetical protein